jgi:inorganic pyrophosphatase
MSDALKLGKGKNFPEDFNVIIEIEANSSSPVKYEFDKDSGFLTVDRFISTPMYYPCNFGFVPNTLSDDGDAADVLVVTPFPIKAGSVIQARAVGVLVMEDEKGMDEKIIAVDCKMNIDDNALMRHADLLAMRDVSEEDPTEVEAGEFNLNFVKLDGNVGCMVNGAGLAMATMDMIKLSGGEPANFLDVGGTANAQTVEAGFRIIMKDPNVKAILINIFGGIVRCDRVAAGVIEAFNKLGNINIPIIVRLQGTNAVEAKKLIDESGLKVQSAIQLSEAADLVKKAVA